MNLTVKPAFALKGIIRLPASKSYSIRAFLIAACGGRSTIIDPSHCDDAIVSLQIAKFLGASVRRKKSASKEQWNVVAFQRRPRLSQANVKESGTVLRFLLPLLALRKTSAIVIGEGTLRGRPNTFLTQALRQMGVNIKGTGKKESVPVRIYGGQFEGGRVTIDGSLSSQFISALLIACPQLQQDTLLTLQGKKVVSSDYIVMTCQVLKKSGIAIRQKSLRKYKIKGNQSFGGLKSFIVPSDYGLTAFLMATAILTKSDVKLTGHLKSELIQADGRILSLLKRMGAQFQKTSKYIHIQGPQQLKGGNFSLKNCPDLVPVMTVLALFARGQTRLYDIAHVRSKESDRISDLRRELLKLGAKIYETRDALTIIPQSNYKKNCLMDPCHDHRLAMAFCVLGSKLGARVKDIECTRKSYPDFVKDFKLMGVSARKES